MLLLQLFEYFVRLHPELLALRDRVFRRNGEPSHEEMMELGRHFQQTLTGDRTASTEKVEAVLASRCFEFKRNPPRGEQEVMALLQRRPCTLQDIAAGLAMHPNEAVKYVDALLTRQEIASVQRADQTFYIPSGD